MAALEADAVSVRTPGTNGQTSPAPTTHKLRDSCQACATSKVKCPKEKPTCSRCESRCVACQYVLTRRPGRRRENNCRQSNAGASTRSSPSIQAQSGFHVEKDTIPALQKSVGACSMTTPAGSHNHCDLLSQGLTIPASPRSGQVFASETSDIFSVLGDTDVFSTLAELGTDSGDMDFIMSAMDSPFGVPVTDSTMTEARNDIGSLLIPPQEINMELASSSDIQVLANGRSEMPRVAGTSTCGCLTQSLDLLKTFSVDPASRTSLAVSFASMTGAFTYGSSSSVLSENKQSIEAISKRLACPSCADDTFLLAVLSITILKILERYAFAAQAQYSSANISELGIQRESGSANSKDNRTQSTPHIRAQKAAQLVLSELHRVQRLVNQLSQKLRHSKDGQIRSEGPDMEPWALERDHEGGPSTPFSSTTLGHIESDVRKGLSKLSSEIIGTLRQI